MSSELRVIAHRYASAVDRRDVPGLLSAFHADATMLVERPGKPVGTLTGHAELSRIPEILARWDRTRHVIAQSAYELAGARASGEIYCTAHHFRLLDGGGGLDSVMHIVYRDDYRVGTDGVWRIARRVTEVEVETRQNWPLLRVTPHAGAPAG